MRRVAAVGLLAAAAFGSDPLSIQRIAPPDSFVVAGVDDLAASLARFERTPIGAWWNSAEVRQRSQALRDRTHEGLEEFARELGVEPAVLRAPASLGVAVFAELDEPTGLYEPNFVLFVDWGAQPEGFAPGFDAALAHLERDASEPYGVEVIAGRRVYVKRPVPAPETADGMGGLVESEEEFEQLSMALDGNRLLVAGTPQAMRGMLARIDGAASGSIAESADFQATMALTGGRDAYVAILAEPAAKLLSGLDASLDMATPYMGQLFGDIRGYGFGVTLDGAQAPVESSVCAYVAGPKVGLLSLFPAGAFEPPPALVPAALVSYSRMNFQFSGLMKVVDDFIDGLPEEFVDEAREGLEPVDATLRGAFGALGPGMHLWTTAAPSAAAADSQSMLAIATSDESPIRQALDIFAPLGGMELRELDGAVMYASGNDFLPLAVGLGRSHMLFGQPDVLEPLFAESSGASLASAPILATLRPHWHGADLVGYGFTNTAATLEAQKATFSELAALLDETAEDVTDDVPLELQDLIRAAVDSLDPVLMEPHFGPSTWTLRSVPSGLRFETRLLWAPK